jgi:hypothetical protein
VLSPWSNDATAEDEAHILDRIAELEKEFESARRRLEATRDGTKNGSAGRESGRSRITWENRTSGKDLLGGHSCRIHAGETRSKDWNASGTCEPQKLRDSVRRSGRREGAKVEGGYDSLSRDELKARVDAILGFVEYLAEKEKTDALRFFLLAVATAGFFLFVRPH